MVSRILRIFFILLIPVTVFSQGTKLLRDPACNNSNIVFVYAGDLWSVDRTGGEARRLTSFKAIETGPHFSPDGKLVAFSGDYTGNSEVYVIDAEGGEPRRITWNPGYDHAVGWTADGKDVLMTSVRASAPINILQLFKVPVKGGLPERLPIRSALHASYSTDGKLLAYQDMRWQDEWKWYRGGQAKPISIISLPDLKEIKVPGPSSQNFFPSFLGNQLYFLSDRNGPFNIFVYDPETKKVSQITNYNDGDIKSLSAGGGILVYERSGVIHTFDPKSGIDKEISITVRGDFPNAMTQWKDVKKYINSASLSPNGERALFEARGDIFTVPAEKGNVNNLTHSSGAADRSPAWSPDGQKIAWFSDGDGEYKLIISDQDGLLPKKKITIDNPTFFFNLCWSPDSKKLAFTNAARELFIVDAEKGTAIIADTDRTAAPERSMIPRWAPDSRWIAYAKQLPNKYRAIMVYSLKEKKSYQATDGLSDAVDPVWDLSGKYLYFLASTDAALNTGWLDLSSLERPERRGVYFAILSKDLSSPLLPESNEEKKTTDEKNKKKEKEEPKKKEADSADVKIDFDGITNRILSLPLPLRNYTSLDRGTSGILFVAEAALPFYPEQPGGQTFSVSRWDMEKRKDAPFLKNVKSFYVSNSGTKVLFNQDDDWFIASSESEPKVGDGKLNVDLKMNLDPIAEWHQIFKEAWRFERDFFYVPNHHGVDWNAVYKKYETYLPFVRSRVDLSYILSMMGGELATGHSFVGGGDLANEKPTPIGLLGADFVVNDNHYQFKRIYSGESWNPGLQAPLAAPGIDVKEGDYLIAINGVTISPPTVPGELLEGFANRQVTLTVNSKPTAEGSHNITVLTVGNESALRSRAWVEDNRRLVDKLSGGKLAYIWLPNTSTAGYTYFNRYFFGQQDKEGAILDERYNGGGYIADYIIDILARKLRGYFNNPVDKREPWTEPLTGIWGPKVMLINEFAGSGGDMMPYMFRQENIGPLIGTKTWGGLVGIWDFPELIDGGYITVPRGGFFNLKGEWDVENKGIEPDIKVDLNSKDIADGNDPQLERAVSEALRLLKANPVKLLKEPAPPVLKQPVNKE